MHKFAKTMMIVAIVAIVPACSSHLIRISKYDGVGSYEKESTSIGGKSGASTEGAGFIAKKCDSADGAANGNLAEVEVRRDFDDTLISILTLGIVTPATIYYKCTKPVIPPPPPPCNCDDDGDQL